jgi:hypothetical protein
LQKHPARLAEVQPARAQETTEVHTSLKALPAAGDWEQKLCTLLLHRRPQWRSW